MRDKIVDFNSLAMLIFGISLAGILAFATQEIWPPMFGVLFALIGGSVIAFRWWRRSSAEALVRTGIPVKAQVVEVFLNQALQVNGKSPFRIMAQWHDHSVNEIRLFESRNIWFDPSSFIHNQDVTVYLEPKRRRRYFMDTSFLPKLVA